MNPLTPEEIESISKNPELAAVAEKLKSTNWIPQARFNEVNEEAKKLRETLAKQEADKAAQEAERLAKQGEYKSLAEAEAKKAAEFKAQLEAEKAEADKFREYRKSKVEAIKKDFGDDWLPEYETFSVESLEKLSAKRTPPASPDGSRPGFKPAGKTLADMTPAEREKLYADAKAGKKITFK